MILVSTLYVILAGYINNFYNLSTPPGNLTCGKAYFDFTGLNFYQKSDIGKVLIWDLKTFLTVGVRLNRACRSKDIFVNSSRHIFSKPSAGSLFLFFLLQSGDVHPHPGPVPSKRNPRYPCSKCSKGVIKSSKFISCSICDKKTHLKCISTIKTDWQNHIENNSFVCDECSIQTLPFNQDQHIIEIDEPNSHEYFYNESGNTIKDPDLFHFSKQRGLHFIHLNARSLLPKISELKIIACKTKAAVISVSETWLDNSVTDAEIWIDNYSIVRKDRNRNGGGVCAYVRNDISFTLASDISENELEAIWIEILLPKSKPIILGTCYRPPNQNNFLELFDSALNKIEPDYEIVILGDMNICMSNKKSPLFKKYCNILNMFSLVQLITEPTRISSSSSSIIDHILCNTKEKISQSGVITVGISDHFITYCTRKATKERTGKQSMVHVRSLKNYSEEEFQEKLEIADWSELYLCRNVNKAWEIFTKLFHSTLNSVAPCKEIKIKQNSEPWMTSDILDYIRKRDNCLLAYKKIGKQTFIFGIL